MKRRTFLTGLAATISVPRMNSMAKTLEPVGAPTRMAFLYVPNGVNLSQWKPKLGKGKDFQLSPSLSPLTEYKKQLQVISGLDHDKAASNGDGPGDHARASATFLTGCQAKKTAGSNIRNGISVDQIAAKQIGHHTKLSSLELSTIRSRKSGSCDSGYSCIYQHNISWRDETTPMPAEYDPRVAFEKLFGSGNIKEDKRRLANRKSVLDFVSNDAKKLHRKLSKEDQEKLDEYLTSVRDVERKIEQAENFADHYPAEAKPKGIPNNFQDHIRAMFDVMTLAFKTDSTRIASFLLSNEGSNRSFQKLGVNSGHHALSHHRNNPDKLEKIAIIDHFYTEQLAYFLEQLQQIKEANGTLLDHTMIVYGSSISDGNRHRHTDLPIILAGGGKVGHGKGAGIHTNRHFKAEKGTPLTNLYLTLLEQMNVSAERIGDSTGTLNLS